MKNEQKTEKQEKIAYSSESILFEDLNPDMWTVTVAASDIEYEEQLQQLIDDFGSDIYNRDNSKSDFSFFIAQAKVEVKAGEVSEALLKLKRVLIESQKIVGITVETATSLYDVITFENFDSFVQEETYLGNELIRTDYDEIPAENIYVSEISEKDVGYVPVTVECVAEGEIYSNTVRIPVTFNYPVPDYDLDFFKTSYDVLECSDLIVNGDPFGREYSYVLVNYYPETAKESEEIVLVMEPEKISWYKEGKIIKEEKTVELKDSGKILNFEIAIDTDQVGTSVYYCAVDYNIIAKTTSEVLDFITPLTATLTSPEFTVEVHDGETLKELSALSVTPREEEFSVKAGSQLRSEDFKFEVTYKLTKGTSVVYKTEEIPSSLWELDSIPSNVIGKYPYRFWIENEDGDVKVRLAAEAILGTVAKDELDQVSPNTEYKGFSGLIRKAVDNLGEMFRDSGASIVDESMVGISGGTLAMSKEEINWSLAKYQDSIDRDMKAGTWDELEMSVLKKLAKDIKISYRNDRVDIVVYTEL